MPVIHLGESHRRHMLGVAKHLQGRIDAIIWHEQLNACCSAYHAHADANDDRGHSGRLQRDFRQVRFYPRRVSLDGFHG